MSEQEAQRFVERLGRVWGFEPQGRRPLHRPSFWLEVELNPEVILTYSWDYTAARSHVNLLQISEGEETGRLYWITREPDTVSITLVYSDMESFQPFAAQWREVFRRGCWLSGCPIEASAHEKAEWMGGFSREEVEAWNLKM